MPCCLTRARRFATGPFLAHFAERALLKYLDHPLHKTIVHRRCGSPFLAIWCGEERDPALGTWRATRWVLAPLTSDELADMEITPTTVLGDRRHALIPSLRAEQWIYFTEGSEQGVGRWDRRLDSVADIMQVPISTWPEVPVGALPGPSQAQS